MNLMLLVIFAAVGVGMFSRSQFGRRETALYVGLAVGLTLLFYLRPYYMT
jgi:hypothetical protein